VSAAAAAALSILYLLLQSIGGFVDATIDLIKKLKV
jgi:hypothetical protein